MPVVDANMLSDPRDLEAARACVKLSREIGRSDAFRPVVSGERIPGANRLIDDAFIRDAAVTYWHQCGTAKMGSDDMSVVDASLAVHGISRLRIAYGSVFRASQPTPWLAVRSSASERRTSCSASMG